MSDTMRERAPTLSAGEAQPRTATLTSSRIALWQRARPVLAPLLVPTAILVPAAQLLLILAIIWFRTFHMPFWDEWTWVPLLQHQQAGALTVDDFWRLHYNTHRLVIPRLMDLGLIDLTHFNRQAMMTVDLAISALGGWLLLSCCARTFKSWRLALFLLAPLSLLYFSMSQYENWFGPFQSALILAMFGVILCVRALDDSSGVPTSRRSLALAICGAMIASLSVFAGLVAWGAFLPSIARPRKWRAWRVGIWLASALAVIVPYMIGFPASSGPRNPVQIAAYALVVLGAPVGYPSPKPAAAAALASIVVVVVLTYVYWRLQRTLDGILVWLNLALFGAVTSVLIVFGRIGDPTAGLWPRYQIYTCVWWIAVLVISVRTLQLVIARRANIPELLGLPAWQWASQPRTLVGIATALVVALSLFTLRANAFGYERGASWLDTMRSDEHCVLQSDPPTDSCLQPFFLPNFVPISNQDLTAYIRREHLAIFYGVDQPTPKDGRAQPRPSGTAWLAARASTAGVYSGRLQRASTADQRSPSHSAKNSSRKACMVRWRASASWRA